MSNVKKKYFRVDEFKDDVYKSQDETFEKGWGCGWMVGDDYMSFKEGYTSYIYSHPHQGKTVFVTECLIHLAKNLRKNVCIYSPEMGSKKDVVWNLIQVYTGKRLYGKGAYKITTSEIEKAMVFINEHFVILEHEPFVKGAIERFTVRDIFNQVHLASKAYGKKINVLCIDPFNLLDRELEDDRKAIADYVLSSLSFINSASMMMGMHTILVAHLAASELIVDKDTGIEYMPKPHPSGLAGGQSFWRAGYQMIGLFREPYGVMKRDGFPYEENCTQVLIQKAKPFGSSKLGMFKVYYDPDTHTMYEKYGDRKFRCGEWGKGTFDNVGTSKIPVSSWFDSPKEKLDAPF